MRSSIRLCLVATLTASFALPASAGAETFQGNSAQGKKVVLTTTPNGELRRLSIRWRTRDCDNGSRMHTRWTSFVQPVDESRPGSFADQGAFTTHYSDATVRFVTAARGSQGASGRWSGTFKIKAHIVRKPGGSVDDCRLGPISWNASP